MLKLVTIAISHYVERVKWALELAGIPYFDEAVGPHTRRCCCPTKTIDRGRKKQAITHGASKKCFFI